MLGGIHGVPHDFASHDVWTDIRSISQLLLTMIADILIILLMLSAFLSSVDFISISASDDDPRSKTISAMGQKLGTPIIGWFILMDSHLWSPRAPREPKFLPQTTSSAKRSPTISTTPSRRLEAKSARRPSKFISKPISRETWGHRNKHQGMEGKRGGCLVKFKPRADMICWYLMIFVDIWWYFSWYSTIFHDMQWNR